MPIQIGLARVGASGGLRPGAIVRRSSSRTVEPLAAARECSMARQVLSVPMGALHLKHHGLPRAGVSELPQQIGRPRDTVGGVGQPE